MRVFLKSSRPLLLQLLHFIRALGPRNQEFVVLEDIPSFVDPPLPLLRKDCLSDILVLVFIAEAFD